MATTFLPSIGTTSEKIYGAGSMLFRVWVVTALIIFAGSFTPVTLKFEPSSTPSSTVPFHTVKIAVTV